MGFLVRLLVKVPQHVLEHDGLVVDGLVGVVRAIIGRGDLHGTAADCVKGGRSAWISVAVGVAEGVAGWSLRKIRGTVISATKWSLSKEVLGRRGVTEHFPVGHWGVVGGFDRRHRTGDEWSRGGGRGMADGDVDLILVLGSQVRSEAEQPNEDGQQDSQHCTSGDPPLHHQVLRLSCREQNPSVQCILSVRPSVRACPALPGPKGGSGVSLAPGNKLNHKQALCGTDMTGQ